MKCNQCNTNTTRKWYKNKTQCAACYGKDLHKARYKDPERKRVIIDRLYAYRKKHPDKIKSTDLKNRFGITLVEYNALLTSQGGVCAICKSSDSGRVDCFYFPVDHDHKTGKVRGLLCGHCNRALGFFKDNIESLQSAISYLKVHNAD